jgi:hypothetical protein
VVVASRAKQEIRSGRTRLNIVRTLVVVVIVVVIPFVVVPVVIVVPVPLVVFPTAIVVVVVRVGPIPSLKGRPAPHSGDPDISAPVPVPISIDPGVTRTWQRSPLFVTQRRRFVANVDTDLGKGWSGNC